MVNTGNRRERERERERTSVRMYASVQKRISGVKSEGLRERNLEAIFISVKPRIAPPPDSPSANWLTGCDACARQ